MAEMVFFIVHPSKADHHRISVGLEVRVGGTDCLVGGTQVIFVGPRRGELRCFIDITITTTREHASLKVPRLKVRREVWF